MSGMRLSMRVWDLPIRSFHWIVTILLIVSYVTQLTDHFGWHFLSGEMLLTLLVWRIIWGFVGSDTSRFSVFLRSPAAGVHHLRGIFRREPDNEIGHNAAGGWWVLVMLTLLGIQIMSGLVASEKYEKGGPLFHLLSPPHAKLAAEIHGADFYVLLGAIVIHLMAVSAYAMFKGQNLVRPMLTGKKRMPAAMRAPRLASASLAALVLICAAGGVVLVLRALSH
jgi:cytochrome b